jgi:hypothetical protein
MTCINTYIALWFLVGALAVIRHEDEFRTRNQKTAGLLLGPLTFVAIWLKL